MKKIEIQKNDAGSRFDKYLKKLFVKASGASGRMPARA